MESSQRQRLPTADLKEVKCWHENDVLFFLRKEPNHSSLKLLHIDCKISLYYVIWIANVLKSSKLIVELVFARYYSGYVCNDGMIAIFEALSNFRNTILTNLDVPGATMNYAAVVAMGHMLKTNESLTKLTIDRCYIKSNGASIVGDSLKQNTTLKSLYLQYNDIGDVGAIAIADGIKEKKMASLNFLDLSYNDIGIVGARYIAAMLTTNESLTDLHLDGNEMMDGDGVIAIVDELKLNKSLTSLSLHGIPCGDDGARNIATIIAINCPLKRLSLNNCSIGDAGAVAIADALQTNTSMTCLRLKGNLFSWNAITDAFASMFKINTTVKELSLGHDLHCDIDVFAGVILETLEEYNDTINLHMFYSRNHTTDVLNKIRTIGEENSRGIRFARRSILKGLQCIWLRKRA